MPRGGTFPWPRLLCKSEGVSVAPTPPAPLHSSPQQTQYYTVNSLTSHHSKGLTQHLFPHPITAEAKKHVPIFSSEHSNFNHFQTHHLSPPHPLQQGGYLLTQHHISSSKHNNFNPLQTQHLSSSAPQQTTSAADFQFTRYPPPPQQLLILSIMHEFNFSGVITATCLHYNTQRKIEEEKAH